MARLKSATQQCQIKNEEYEKLVNLAMRHTVRCQALVRADFWHVHKVWHPQIIIRPLGPYHIHTHLQPSLPTQPPKLGSEHPVAEWKSTGALMVAVTLDCEEAPPHIRGTQSYSIVLHSRIVGLLLPPTTIVAR